jgi:hypothetical protein
MMVWDIREAQPVHNEAVDRGGPPGDGLAMNENA